ncbi:MAG: hypothetical protein P1Q69_09170 [Candidatus Thorarchaeota archaeon]|nr:hypothetical protein [Candidatus Thorarchaeota archaeon]
MKGSKNSASLFFIAAILLIIQAGISLAVFDDWVGGMVGGTFAFVMFVTMAMAYKGELAAVMHTTVTETPDYATGGVYRTTTSRDTGDRIQQTPCCGICGGIAVIVVAAMFGADLGEGIIMLAPGFLAGILAIIASIVFIVEYKGPWTGQAY